MAFVRDLGYPAPAVEEVRDDGLAIVMERIDGGTMVDALMRRPWSARSQGRLLGELHTQLHALRAPPWAEDAPMGSGDRMLHLDLHPLNVMIGRHGPVVIDWTNARRGDPAVDVALSWAIVAAGQVETNRLVGKLATRLRSSLLSGFLSVVDREDAARALRLAVTWKVRDANLSADEQAAMWRLVQQVDPRETSAP